MHFIALGYTMCKSLTVEIRGKVIDEVSEGSPLKYLFQNQDGGDLEGEQ